MVDLAAPPVIQYWHAEQPPQPIAELMATFPARNPCLPHVVFNRATADAFIAGHFPTRQVEAFRACATPTSQADYLRYCAGFVMGGLCIDADVRCKSALDSLFARSERGTVFGQLDPPSERIARIAGWPHSVGRYRTLVNGAFTFARSGDPLLELAIEVATANIENRRGDGPIDIWVTTGPGVLTAAYLLHRLGSIDAFLRYTKGTVLERSAALFCEVVADAAKVDSAFEGIDMLAVEETGAWFEHVGVPRSSTAVNHWSSAGGGISP